MYVDGIYGNQTYHAVIDFQNTNHLTTDGIVGVQTRNALKNAVITVKQNISINQNMYTTTNVYFRQGPATSYPVKTLLNKNTIVYVYQIRSDGWAYVKFKGMYGYVYGKYLSFASSETNVNPTTSLSTFTRNTSHLLDLIKACKSYYATHDFVYNLSNGARTIPADKSTLFDGHYCVDCSSYVTWVLYEYALANGKTDMKNYFSYQRSSSTFASIGAMRWKRVSFAHF